MCAAVWYFGIGPKEGTGQSIHYMIRIRMDCRDFTIQEYVYI